MSFDEARRRRPCIEVIDDRTAAALMKIPPAQRASRCFELFYLGRAQIENSIRDREPGISPERLRRLVKQRLDNADT